MFQSSIFYWFWLWWRDWSPQSLWKVCESNLTGNLVPRVLSVSRENPGNEVAGRVQSIMIAPESDSFSTSLYSLSDQDIELSWKSENSEALIFTSNQQASTRLLDTDHSMWQERICKHQLSRQVPAIDFTGQRRRCFTIAHFQKFIKYSG